MATLLLAAGGSALGGALGGAVLGISTAAIGQALGGVLGSVIDQRLMGGLGTTRREGPRLGDLALTATDEGGPLPEVWGRMAVGGSVIWATRLREEIATDTTRVGSGKAKSKVKTTEYRYYASFAVSLSEGEIGGIGRIWLDEKLFDPATMAQDGRLRWYPGSETQAPDPLIEAIEGSAPAFRGTAYLVFEDLPVADYGNRIPRIRVEVFGKSGAMERLVRGVNLIPGSTEWGYDPAPANSIVIDGSGRTVSEAPMNRARHQGKTDWHVALDALAAQLPAADTVSLVVAWFGTDLRAGLCEVEPRAEYADRDTNPRYLVAGLRSWSSAYDYGGALGWTKVGEVSRVAGAPAYGSSPADAAVIRAIVDLKARGKRVILYPFVMMDVQASQALPHPSGSGTQPDFPWRGRIAPRAGQPVASEVAAFMGSAAAADFSVTGEVINYAGPDEWRFRRFILHLAHLAQAAGGVDAMLIGSEMVGMTTATDTPGVYPFVSALQSLAGEVRTVLPSALISYAADWSEYHSHRVGGEVYFHLDPLWSDPEIDFIGIDNYLPLADWRDGSAHADYDPAGPVSQYDLAYLKANVEGGEYWDWYYTDDAARAAQTRTPISDGAYGKPWVFRQKAIRAWHGNAHYNRPSGVEAGSPTGWTPGSKPIWFTELGCPAIDKGANQPNVFAARLSSESAVPWFSSGIRDDAAQRAYLTAALEWWRDNGGSVLDVDNVQIWCWDARPFPEFPTARLWADGPDWRRGHWLNGRACAAPLRDLAAARIYRHGMSAADLDMTRAHAVADGYAVPGPTSFRDLVQPYEVALGAQVADAGGLIVIEDRRHPLVLPAATAGDAVLSGEDPWRLTRAALEDRPGRAILRFADGDTDYSAAAAEAILGAGAAAGAAEAQTPLGLDLARAHAAAETMLRGANAAVERVSIVLPRSISGIRPGVVLPLDLSGAVRPFVVETVTMGEALRVEGTLYSATAWAGSHGPERAPRTLATIGSEAVLLVPLDLPVIASLPAIAEWDGWFAAHAAPWPGAVGVLRATTSTGTGPALTVDARSAMGETLADLDPAAPWEWSDATLSLRLYAGSLASRTEAEVLAGANLLALEHAGGWEVVQFRDAALVGPNEWEISRLIRGRRGTDPLSAATLPAGARAVLLSSAVTPAGLAEGERGQSFWWRYGAASVAVTDYAALDHRFTGAGLKPFAPAHLTAAPDGSGGIALAWVRRSRSTALADMATAAPLAEASERYRVEIGPAGAPVRVKIVTAPAATWSAAEIAADALSGPVQIRVAQVSEIFGPGWAATIEVTP